MTRSRRRLAAGSHDLDRSRLLDTFVFLNVCLDGDPDVFDPFEAVTANLKPSRHHNPTRQVFLTLSTGHELCGSYRNCVTDQRWTV